MLRLAVFLGNPGAEYRNTRHNAGRLLAERLPSYPGLRWTKKFRGLYAAFLGEPPSGEAVHLLIPETYMNLAGRSAAAAAAFYKINPEEIIAVHDELELELGTVSFKEGGGLGGHNGLRSLKEALGSASFWRLRIGIGRPAGRRPGEGGPPVRGIHEGGAGEIADWVLSPFSEGESTLLGPALDAAACALEAALTGGPESLFPEWKKKRIAEY